MLKERAIQAAKQASEKFAARAAPKLDLGPPAVPRSYFLALAEYGRRRNEPLPCEELVAHELRVSSQNGEDGVIQEIFRRIDTNEQPFFVEFGIENGCEGNAVLLADACAWRGLFIEADPDDYQALERKYRHGQVQTRQTFVTPSNVEQVLSEENVPVDLDLLSIDVDGDDYWILTAIQSYRPRLLIIEYNPDRAARTVQAPGHGPWQGTNDVGASIEALIDLGTTKDYRFVHTETAGVNAFFVRSDLPGDWPSPRTAGANYYLRSHGHPIPVSPRPEIVV